MEPGDPRWRRRKEARPAEIVSAALEVFLERGFGSARMETVAERAGLSKGSLYRYYPSKEALLRAAVGDMTSNEVEDIKSSLSRDEPFSDAVVSLLAAVAAMLAADPVPALMRLVVTESRAVLGVAEIWQDAVAAPVLATAAALVVRAQTRGECVPGEPRLIAISLVAPFVMTTLFREVFPAAATIIPASPHLAQQHAQTVLQGLLPTALHNPAAAEPS